MEDRINTRKHNLVKALQNEDEKLLIDLLIFDDDQEQTEVRETLRSMDWIMPRVCELGFTNILNVIFDFHVVNINEAKYEGKTGLQHACEKGHVDVVKWLLEHEAKLKESVWEEESEFYMATLNGNQDVIDVLISRMPKLAKDQAVRDCLMYTACLGGHIESVKKWYTPSTNVVGNILFVSDLNVCENRYPLYAACQGNHFEVAEFLINETNASITRDICLSFPEFTTQLVRTMCVNYDENGQMHFKMANCNIEYILPCWFLMEKKDSHKTGASLEVKDDAHTGNKSSLNILIDIQKNRLSVVPDEVLWTLRELISLNASHNPIRIISDPPDPSSLHLNQLQSLKLTNCSLESLSSHIFALPCLEDLNLSHNKLFTLSAKESSARTTWKCSRLLSLDISHNLLASLPHDIMVCTELVILNAGHNHLVTACMAWQCPLKILDLSYNRLTSFVTNADQYWGNTLQQLFLQNNQMTELAESIVKMSLLAQLDISQNKIQHIPSPNLWICPLSLLNLNDNNLGINTDLEFSESCLTFNLISLYMAGNNLATVPKSVGSLQHLGDLDLSRNPKITGLPEELGKLKELYKLKMTDIKVKDKELQKLISALNTDRQGARDVVDYLERKRRKCVTPGILKIVVLGCENAHGHCIVQELTDDRNKRTHDHKSLTVTELILKKQKDTLKIVFWELPDSATTSALLPIFTSHNSMYLIVIDVNLSNADLNCELERASKKVSEIVASVRLCKARFVHQQILVVFTFMKVLRTDNKKIKEILTESMKRFPKLIFVPVTYRNRDDLCLILEKINKAWENMKDDRSETDVKLCQRQVPGMFVEVVQNIKRRKKQQDICRMEEFLQIAECRRMDLEDGVDHKLKLHEFLLQAGAILHYGNHMKELSDCVVLNPAWLYEVLSKLLESLVKTAQKPVTALRKAVQDFLPKGDNDYFPVIIQLLEAFGVGVRMTDSTSKKDEIFLVPCLLQERQPAFLHDEQKDAFKAARLYCLSNIPPTFWSHVIFQLIQAFERFSESTWNFGEQKSYISATVNERESSWINSGSSARGLHIKNKKIHYWRTGIRMYHDEGHVVVEQVECMPRTGNSNPGVLVTVQATRTVNNPMEQCHDNKLSVMGIVADELQEIMEFFNPKFRDPSDSQTEEIYALCPHCYDIKPGPHIMSISLDGIHFTVKECAQTLLSEDLIMCQKGPSCLDCLVPEFMLMELPSELRLTAKDIVLLDENLGHGLMGKVKKGTYKGSDVAVKIFYDSPIQLCQEGNSIKQYQNAKDAAAAFKKQQNEDLIEQTKLINAFSDVRKEAGILCKLKHEFIITFIGICVKPQLLLVMELAPLGSLRAELKRRTELQKRNTFHSSGEVSESVFGKDLTYKFVLQIGCALCYLHENNIIYRDLKPDNILIMSLSVDDKVNLKLSDYGISKFATLQGASGHTGTLGYMAPEISNHLYTKKVDIYSYAIVMLEILTGLPPPGRPILSQSHADNAEAPPVHIQGWKIQCNFPYLESLMKECWIHDIDKRPSSESVVKRMKSDQFLLLHDSILLDKNNPESLEITCVYACQTAGRWNIWICESGHSNHRYISVYDAELANFIVARKECNGARVIDMAKVGSSIWIVCKEMNCLEVIVRGHTCFFEISQGVTLRAKATKLLNHSFGTSEDKSLILVGLENGCVTAFPLSTSDKMSEIQLTENKPVAIMCSVNHGLIAIACGITVNFLQVRLQDGPENDCQSKEDIWIPELINCGSVCLKNNVLNKDIPIASMIAHGTAVWCSLEFESHLVKIDVNHKKIELILTLTWDSKCDTVTLQEMKIESVPNIWLVTSEGGAVSRTSEFYDVTQNQSNQINVFEDDVFTTAGPNENPVYSKRSSIDHDSDKDCVRSFNNDIDPHLISGYENNDLNRNRSETVSPGNTLPLPPKEKFFKMKKAASMPGLNRQKPPLLPRRAHHQEVHISITSLGSSADILILGTSCGGIVLFPFAYSHCSDTFGNSQTLPVEFPMLRHLTKKKSPQAKSGSFPLMINEQAMSLTGTISILTLASDKLVSLHIRSKQVRHCKSRSESGNKRKGILLPNTFTLDFTRDKLTTEQKSLAESKCEHSGSSLPEAPQPSSADGVVDMQSFEVADIAVWDRITWNRLKTVRSYSHDVKSCTGWCCRASNSVPLF